MSDRIELRELEVTTRIGVRDWERRVRQVIRLDLDLAVNARPAAAADDLALALDYSEVVTRVRAFAADSERLLIETFAEDLAAELLSAFRLHRVRIVLHKPGAVADAGPVRLVIEREA